MIDILKSHLPLIAEIIKVILELGMFVIILKEIRALGRHEKALEKHGEKLMAVRPLYTTLYTSAEEIMDLAVTFTKEAKDIYALGTISSLIDTEMRPNEDDLAFEERLKTVGSKTTNYIAATREHILGGRKYCRIADFVPSVLSQESILEILANVNFFLRIMEFRGAGTISLELYHNPEILKGRGDFHFRCSDRQVVLRAGGHGNNYANAAIAISDTSVVHEYQQYFQSLINSEATQRLEHSHLVKLRELLIQGNINEVSAYLSGLPRGIK